MQYKKKCVNLLVPKVNLKKKILSFSKGPDGGTPKRIAIVAPISS